MSVYNGLQYCWDYTGLRVAFTKDEGQGVITRWIQGGVVLDLNLHSSIDGFSTGRQWVCLVVFCLPIHMFTAGMPWISMRILLNPVEVCMYIYICVYVYIRFGLKTILANPRPQFDAI